MILADLKAAAQQLPAHMFEDADDADASTISTWLRLNGLTHADLRAQGN